MFTPKSINSPELINFLEVNPGMMTDIFLSHNGNMEETYNALVVIQDILQNMKVIDVSEEITILRNDNTILEVLDNVTILEEENHIPDWLMEWEISLHRDTILKNTLKTNNSFDNFSFYCYVTRDNNGNVVNLDPGFIVNNENNNCNDITLEIDGFYYLNL